MQIQRYYAAGKREINIASEGRTRILWKLL